MPERQRKTRKESINLSRLGVVLRYALQRDSMVAIADCGVAVLVDLVELAAAAGFEGIARMATSSGGVDCSRGGRTEGGRSGPGYGFSEPRARSRTRRKSPPAGALPPHLHRLPGRQHLRVSLAAHTTLTPFHTVYYTL
jgi:hypothetical protein